MSHIPNNAIPHAGPQPETQTGEIGTDSRFPRLAEYGSGLVGKVKEHPKTAAVAGAAMVGLAAAAAYPAIRGRSRGDGKGGLRKKKD